jgi:hypothetical protein
MSRQFTRSSRTNRRTTRTIAGGLAAFALVAGAAQSASALPPSDGGGGGEGGGGGTGGGTHPVTLTVTLLSLNCTETEDTMGADEPYLLFNGDRVWGNSSMNNSEGESINITRKSSGVAWVELYDEDSGVFWDDDDHLGTIFITKEQKGQGLQVGRFTSDGADYTLFYQVT